MKQKAMVAMSGGVDSSVAAFLALRSGLDCVGANMRLLKKEEALPCSTSDIQDAAAVAKRLSMPFLVFELQEEFARLVMDPFVRSYESGLTPNPCVCCNRYLKFGTLLDKAREAGCDYLVTGHYCRIRYDESSSRYLLLKAADAAKDQSYFLYALTQEQLAHTLFPLGELSKEQVRSIAREQDFLNARKRDSQDICFVPDGDYFQFMKEYTGKTYPEGDFLDMQGNTVGKHRGAVGYTRGQRKGLGLAMGHPVYVFSKDMARNTVTVADDRALFSRSLRANDWNWIALPQLQQPIRVMAKARSRMTEQPATVFPEENGFARVEFDEPQRAITTGQAVVLYSGQQVIGGGTISEVL